MWADHDEAMTVTHRLVTYRFDRRLVKTPRIHAGPVPCSETIQSGGQLLPAMLHCCSVDDPAVVGMREIWDVQDLQTAVTTTRLI